MNMPCAMYLQTRHTRDRNNARKTVCSQNIRCIYIQCKTLSFYVISNDDNIMMYIYAATFD